MPSFDVVSEVDIHEVTNGVDQANREVKTRFDFKGTDARFEQNEDVITLFSEGEFQLGQMMDILNSKLHRRGVDIACLEKGKVESAGKQVKQQVTIKQGLETPLAKQIVKMIKEKKMKVQAAIQGEKVRITGKKRDDLQQVISMLKEAKLDMPLQYNNFRD